MICNLFLDFCLYCSALETLTPVDIVKGFMNSTFLDLKPFLPSIPRLFLLRQETYVNASRQFTSKRGCFLSGAAIEQITSDKAV